MIFPAMKASSNGLEYVSSHSPPARRFHSSVIPVFLQRIVL